MFLVHLLLIGWSLVSLLRNYSTGIPTIVFWILMITPLFIFTSQYTPFLVAILKQILVTPGEIILGYTITSTIGESLGGILIGISFWISGRTINNFRIKNYMYISAVGYICILSSNYAINASSPSYPPFGLVGILYVDFICLSCIYWNILSRDMYGAQQ